MRTLLTGFILFWASLTFAQNIPNIVFNELNMDNPGGADVSEFVELYGTPGASLDSLVIVLFEGSTDLSYQAYDLDGYFLDNNGFFVLGNAAAANVDFVIPNATISNGADGIAIYIADANDFPADTPPTTLNLVDAAVYGTGDGTDAGLITALGLDIAVAGYTQLDETAQQAGADLSISRTPDGGSAFNFGSWTLQEITAGTFNTPPCFASSPTFADGSGIVSLCAGAASSLVELLADSLSYGDNQLFVITNDAELIQFTTSSAAIDFSSLSLGTYSIYNLMFNGALNEATTASGLPLSGILAGNCVSTSSNPLTVELVSCSGCIGGTISATINNGSSYCGGSIPAIVASNTSTSIEDGYLYVVADAGGAIIDTFALSYDAGALPAGSYSLIGLSYLGGLNGLDSLSNVASDICLEWSDNAIDFVLFDCPYVVFNELNIDNPGGGDIAEFIELYGTPEASLENLVLVLFEGNTDNSYGAYDLDGYSLDENGFFVIGNAATVNVDYVIPDATISNGGDGVGLYIGNDTDFPNGTLPTTENLIEAAVYGTADPTDNQLITALGLDVAAPGYTQLDETFQQTLPDFSLSRYPDGGQPFNFSPYVLQEITPGMWNQPQCMADSLFAEGAVSFCDNDPMAVASWYTSGNGYGDQSAYIIADAADDIIELSDVANYNFTGFAAGSYHIYSLFYNGSLDSSTVEAGMSILGITAGNCVSVGELFLTIEITPCSGCVGGEVSLTSGTGQVCNTTTTPLALSSTGTSLDDTYLFVLTDTAGTIVAVDPSAISVEGLTAGAYSIVGISYQGEINGMSIGALLTGVSSSACLEFSSNTLSIEVFACTDNSPCTELFFSEYLEGTNGTKAIEIFNPSLETVDLSEYSIVQYANGVTAATNTLNLSGALGPFGTYVIANPGQGGGGGAASQTVLGLADLVNQIANYNGNDALELRHNDTIIDVIGVVGENPGTGAGWPVGDATTFDFDLVRQFNIQSPMPVWAISADQWVGYPANDYSHLGNHFFQPCTDETLAGFVNGDINVAENAGTITINVQCLNASGPIALIASLQGGTADNTDYTAILPDTLYFNDASALQNFTIDVINDATAEGAETIVLTLESDSTVTWLQQTMTITIGQSDPNCDGGFLLGAGQGAIVQCSDLPNTPVDLTPNTNQPNATYVYLITDASDLILEIVTSAPVSLDAYGEGTFHIWGLSYTGNLDMESAGIGMPISGIMADQCAELSNNFATIDRVPCIITGCDAGEVLIDDGADFITICNGDVHIDVIMTNSGQSIDASYTYFVTDASGIIIEQIDGIWNGASAAPGTYYIYGVSYLNNLDESTTQTGMPVSGITADNCVELSANYVEAIVYNCSGSSPCSQLFFSEILEDSQSNKAIEIYNPSPLPVDLSNYSVNLYTNGAAAPSATLTLSGTLAAHDVYVISSTQNGPNPVDPAIAAVTDVADAVSVFTGNDAIELMFQNSAIDVVGEIGVDPGGAGWVFGNSSTANHALVRRPEVTSPNTDWNIVSGQWITFEPTDYTHLGSHDANDCGNVPVAVVGFTTSTQIVPEINSTIVTITIHTENVQSSFQLIVNAAGTASAGSDYSAGFPLSFTVPEGTNDLTFSIVILGDALIEGDETIQLDLSANANVYFTIPTQIITITENVGLNQLAVSGFMIYPNPASTQLNILAQSSIQRVQCLDLSGRVVQSIDVAGNPKQFLWDVSSLSNGSYIISIVTENELMRIPVQVMK
jgi:hypothetical protein